MTTSRAPNRRQGPNRSDASHAAILDAAASELTEKGWRGFSVDNVARRAKASKQTIYRWWDSICALCVECVIRDLHAPSEDARDPEQRDAALIIPFETLSRSSSGKEILRGALLAVGDDDIAAEKWRAWIKENIREPLRMLLVELSAKNVIRRDWDIDLAIEFLLGPFWHRMIVRHSMAPEGFSRVQARRFLKVWAA